MKVLPIILVFVIILSGLGIFTVLNKEETLPDDDIEKNTGESGIISTDKKTYNKGENVTIEIAGNLSWSSTTLLWGYVIKDDKGHWVRESSMLTTMDIRRTNGPLHYTWDQKYRLTQEYFLDGNYSVNFPKNGEQVPAGIYYIYPTSNVYDVVEIEIVDQQ